MGKRTYFEDSASLALLYNYDATNGIGMMLSYNKIKKFDNIININLDSMNSQLSYIGSCNPENLIYFYSKDEEQKEYLILRPDIDLEKARNYYIGSIPLDLLIASQKENALNSIGLKLENRKIVKLHEEIEPQRHQKVLK